MTIKTKISASATAVILLALVFALGRCSAPADVPEPTTAEAAVPRIWACPMHPHIRQNEPGTCGNCGMDLELLTDTEEDPGPGRLAMSPNAKALAAVETAPVERRFATLPVRMVGKVDYDETAVRTISARVPGRLDRLYVDYTGVSVQQGDHLVSLYSPELLTAQQELLEAKARVDAAAEASEFLRASNRRAYDSAREKLLLWGVTADQVDEIERRGDADDHLMITSPTAGVVVHKAVHEGDYVSTGARIYRIADLSKVWVRLDAYEQDLPWLHYGQEVSVHVAALPGRVLTGWISFIDPVLDERTRTVKVRVNLPNPERLLKPGMFVDAIVEARVAAGGRAFDPRLAGKWISPMHPEIVKDGPGQCDVCGMDLVPAEQLGFDSGAGAEPPLVVPATAVLLTGKRGVVYVEVPGAERPTYEGREVLLGPRAGDLYLVESGVQEGERVVVRGLFRIDSSMQIRAKRSMLSMPAEHEAFTGPAGAGLRSELAALFAESMELQAALAADAAPGALELGAALPALVPAPTAGALPRRAERAWRELQATLVRAVDAQAAAADLDRARSAFGDLSRALIEVVSTFGNPLESALREVHCPMAFDNAGASWLQPGDDVANPYFGASMLRCGDGLRSFEPAGGTATGKPPESAREPRPAREPDPAREPEPVREPTPVDPTAKQAVFNRYFALQAALAADDRAAARQELTGLSAALAAARHAPAALAAAADTDATEIESMRAAFHAVSTELIAWHESVGHAAGTWYRIHCPMAFDDTGADWLQRERTVRNPYFGPSMLGCGKVTAELPGEGR